MNRAELIELCYEATDYLDVLDRGDAAALADDLIDAVVDELRNDPSVPQRTFFDWLLALADLRGVLEEWIAEIVEDRVNLRDAIREIVNEIDGESIVRSNGRPAS